MNTSSAGTLFQIIASSLGLQFLTALGIILGIVAGLVGIGWAWRKFTKHTGLPTASVMSREQRNRRYEDFFNRRLERGIERF